LEERRKEMAFLIVIIFMILLPFVVIYIGYKL